MMTSRCSICRPRRSSGIGWRWPTSRHDVFFFCIVPSQNLDNAWNADALTACHKAQTHWIQAMSRRSEGAEGYEIKFAHGSGRIPGAGMAIAFARTSCWKSRSRKPTSTMTGIPACCA